MRTALGLFNELFCACPHNNNLCTDCAVAVIEARDREVRADERERIATEDDSLIKRLGQMQTDITAIAAKVSTKRDREVRAAALREACAKVEQWFSIASRAPSFDSWAAMRRALSEMVDKAERGE